MLNQMNFIKSKTL